MPGHLEAERAEERLRLRGAVGRGDDRDHHLLFRREAVGRYRVGGRLDDAGLGPDCHLHLERRDVLAAPADRVLEPVLEDEVALLVEQARIAGVEPEVPRDVERRLCQVPVALEDRKRLPRPPHGLADLARRQWVVVLVDDRHLDLAAREAHRAELAREAGPEPGAEPDLGRAVYLPQRHPEPLLPRGHELRRGTRAERAGEPVLAVARRRRVLPEEENDGAEVAHPRRAAGIDVVPEPARRESRAELDPVAGPEGGSRAGRPPHLVEEGEHRVADVVVAEVEPLHERHDVVDRAAVVVHRALRAPGRAGRVHDVREVELSRSTARNWVVFAEVRERVRRDALRRLAVLLAHDDEVADVRELHGAEAVEPARVHHEDARARVAEDVLEEGAAVLDVDRDLDRPEPDDRVPGRQVVVARRQHRGDPIAGPRAERGERPGDA